MKFSTYLETIMGVSIYPIISLVIFTVFFTAVLLWISRMDKQHIEDLEQLPFND
jgi:cytochrome c oxidase cbb3-type subunit 3